MLDAVTAPVQSEVIEVTSPTLFKLEVAETNMDKSVAQLALTTCLSDSSLVRSACCATSPRFAVRGQEALCRAFGSLAVPVRPPLRSLWM